MKTAQIFLKTMRHQVKVQFNQIRLLTCQSFFSFGELVLSCCVVLKGKLTTYEKDSSLEYFGQKFLLGVGRAL